MDNSLEYEKLTLLHLARTMLWRLARFCPEALSVEPAELLRSPPKRGKRSKEVSKVRHSLVERVHRCATAN